MRYLLSTNQNWRKLAVEMDQDLEKMQKAIEAVLPRI